MVLYLKCTNLRKRAGQALFTLENAGYLHLNFHYNDQGDNKKNE